MRISGRTFRALLLLIVFAGLALRLWNIDFGLPAGNHRDEKAKYPVILRIARGEPPDYLLHPGLLVNSVGFPMRVLERVGAPDDFTTVILLGRHIVAIVGSMTVLLAGLLARRIAGDASGLVAAAALAFSPLHTTLSRYVKEDVHLFFGIVALLTALAYWSGTHRSRSDRVALVLAVVATGWCMAAKYVGFLSLLTLLGGIWWGGRNMSRKARLLLSVVAIFGAVVTFFALSPQALNSGLLRRDFFYELHHGLGRVSKPSLPIWNPTDLGTWFFIHGVGWGAGWPQAILGLGAGIWLTSRKGPWIERLMALTCLGWYIVAELTPTKLSGGVERYVLPAAGLIGALHALLATTKIRAMALSVLLLIPACHSALIAHSIEIGTRQRAADWMRSYAQTHHVVLGQLAKPDDAPGELKPNGTMNVPFPPSKEGKQQRILDKVDAVSISSVDYSRFAAASWDKGSRAAMKNLAKIRKQFPYVVLFEQPDFLMVGTHNPRIEIRFREPVDGSRRM